MFSVLELANYLKALYTVPRFGQVIEMMKTAAQFESAFNQLAFGFRFREIGGEEMEFEPPTDKGRNSDVLFRYKGDVFIAESFVPAKDREVWYQDLLNFSAKRVYEAAKEQGKRVIAFVTIRNQEEWGPELRKDLERRALPLVRAASPGNPSRENCDHFDVEIHDTCVMTEAEEEALFQELFQISTCGVKYGMMDVNDTKKVMRGEKVQQSRSIGRFLMKVDAPEPSTDEMLSKLAQKMEQKISQLRKAELKPKGILLVGTHHGDPSAVEKRSKLERVKKKVIGGHADVAGAFLARRVQNEDGLPFFTGTFLEGETGGASSEVFSRLVELEWGRDFLIR